MTKRKPPEYTYCLECSSELPEGRNSRQKFCSNKTCGVIWRTKNVYRYKYCHAYRSKGPDQFMKSLLTKKGGKRSSLSIEYLMTLWVKQSGKCALTGRDMTYLAGNGRVGSNISLDQIIPNGGYVEGNIQLVTRDANQVKGTLTIDDLVLLCKDILTNNGSYIH